MLSSLLKKQVFWVLFSLVATMSCIGQTWLSVRVFTNDMQCRHFYTARQTAQADCEAYVSQVDMLSSHCHCRTWATTGYGQAYMAVFNDVVLALFGFVFILGPVVTQLNAIVKPCHVEYIREPTDYTLLSVFGFMQLVMDGNLRALAIDKHEALLSRLSIVTFTADTLTLIGAHQYASALGLASVSQDTVILFTTIVTWLDLIRHVVLFNRMLAYKRGAAAALSSQDAGDLVGYATIGSNTTKDATAPHLSEQA